MAFASDTVSSPPAGAAALLAHFGRLQLPRLRLTALVVEKNLYRTFCLFERKSDSAASWSVYLAALHAVDWLVAIGCLEGGDAAWEILFAARTGRSDCLLVDALRARAVRLYPHDAERQDHAVTEFWSHLLIAETEGSIPVLARYDGQRPLVPWLIRVFQNWHISLMRQHPPVASLIEEEVSLPLPPPMDGRSDSRWHEAFRLAAHECLAELGETDLLILGLRVRYQLSQREVAQRLGVHEGTVSRQTTQLRERCLEGIARRLLEQGWTGDDLSDYVRLEMGSLLLDEPRLSADRLAALLANRGKRTRRPE